jgi:mannosyl-3-phosphoglycerate phosphatase
VYQAEFQDGYEIVRLGTAYPELRRALATLKERGLKLRGFGDMPAEEVAEITGLNIAEARLAKEREFDEPFLFEGDEAELVRGIASLGFSWTKGRFFHILGDSDKGRAVSILVAAYRRTFGEVFSVGIGDNINDLPMLREVEYPILVQRPDGSYTPGIDVPKLVHAAGPGPSGWNKEVLRLLNVCV